MMMFWLFTVSVESVPAGAAQNYGEFPLVKLKFQFIVRIFFVKVALECL